MRERPSRATIETSFESLLMTNSLPSVLIVAKQNRLRDSLRVLLTSFARIGFVAVASDFSSNLVENESAPPALVLLALDSTFSNSRTLLTLQRMKSTWPSTRIVTLVADEGQYQVDQIAEADVTLLQGTTAAVILKQINELLPGADS